ncbi:MAG: triple tyrosine motif-containing protein, partial [Flavobacteriales bacterium]
LVAISSHQGNDFNIIHEDVVSKYYGYEDGFLGVGCNERSILQATDGSIWIGADDRLTVCHPEGLLPDTLPPNMQVTGISLFNELIAWPLLKGKQDSTLVLKNGMQVKGYSFSDVSRWYGLPENLNLAYNNNYITFNFIGITMNQPKQVKYKYKLEGMDENWSGLTSSNEATYGNLPQGTYTFLVKAMNSDGVWSEPFQYTFTIRPPWWLTWWAYAAYAIFIVGSIFSYIRWRERSLRARQKELEIKVDEATVVIRKQKDEVEHQKEVVEEKNREILDSIEYAKRIQTAILPPPRIIKSFLKGSFILYLPKDIVAGDFYWMDSMDDTIYFAACDCTGHGVPGALVSVVCNNALNRSV